MNEPGNGNEARLEKIQGGIDLIAERLLHSNQINDERHNAVKADIHDIRETQHRHSNRIGVLEKHNTLKEGERKGVAFSGRIVWAASGLIPGGAVVAILMKLFGH